MDESTKDRILQHCIKTNTLDSVIIYIKDFMDQFFEAMKEKKYPGPFRKPMFTQHSTFLKRAKLSGVTLQKNRASGAYYTSDPDFIKEIEPVTFDPEFLDIPKE